MAVTSSWVYYFVYIIPLSAVLGHYFQLPLFTLFVTFGVVPLLDIIIGNDEVNPTSEEEKELANAFRFKLVTLLWCPVHISLIVWGVHTAATETMTNLQWWSLVTGVGITGGLSINCAHELLHKLNFVEQFAAKVVLSFVCYTHFCIEHVVGHHKRVATPEDPASARLGESFYMFYPRTVVRLHFFFFLLYFA